MSLLRNSAARNADDQMESIIKDAEKKIGELKSLQEQDFEPDDLESEQSPEPLKNENKELRTFWLRLDVKVKRDFMKVCTEKLLKFVEGVHSLKARETLKEVLDFVKKDKKWTYWMCCSEKFSSADDCKKHFEQNHAADFLLSSEKDVIKGIGKDWSRKILFKGWQPVDTEAAVELITNHLADVKAFEYKDGWSKEWPLADDEERRKLLKEIETLLGKFCKLKILPCRIRDYVMSIPARYLSRLGVSAESLAESHLKETPQSICFLEPKELRLIHGFLKSINRRKCESEDGKVLVTRAVKSTLVKEKIDFDHTFSFLLLDRRLLKSNNVPFHDEETINIFDPSKYYGKAQVQGDGIISWLTDYKSVGRITDIQDYIREHNLVLWVAILRAVQYTCRTLRSKYEKKRKYQEYGAALTVVQDLCMSESERRKNLDEDQWTGLASLLCHRCEERVLTNPGETQVFVRAVRDVLKQTSGPIFGILNIEECLNIIRERSNSLDDSTVVKSITRLRTAVLMEGLLNDVKILLVDNSRTSLLNDLIKLSGFDNRTYILQVLKPFLLNEIMVMQSKAKLDAAAAAEAYLLLEEEKKSPSKNKPPSKKTPSKRKNSQTRKKNPNSMSPSLVEEDSVELDDTLSEERDPLEISSNTVNQEKDMQNMPGDITQSEPLESTLGEAPNRYNSALDMTLKALLNIKILKEDLMHNREPFQPVPPALENFFTATVSEVIKTEEIYPCLLSDLLAALEEDISMSNDAAEVLVAILEFWQCWKNSKRESLVTRLFTLEEYERMTCGKCRKKPNYPEQSSYGIVMAADSIRDLKCDFGDTDFVDIFKMIRMEYKMLCDTKTGGCGRTNIVHHVISKCPPIFTIVLEWEKNETEKEISETTNALDWEIDISMLYGGLKANPKYRLVSMVGCGEEEDDHICIAYETNRWINLRTGKVVGNWKCVVRFCEEKKVRPEILFYEAARSKEEIMYNIE